MKNVNVLLAVVLCAGLCVLFRLFNRSADDSLGWSPNEMYMQSMSGEGASFTSANMSGSNVSNDGVAVSMRSGSFSLRTRASRASMPVAAPQTSSLSLSGSTSTSSSGSLIGHMTSSAEYHSFCGGHSGNMGSAMTGMTNSGNVAAIFAYSSPSYGVASSGLSSYSPITLSSGTDGTQIMSAEQALISASSSANGLFGGMMTSYGTASYGDYVGMSSGQPNGVRGRQNATPGVGGGGSTYADWLKWFDEIGYAYGTADGSGGYTFDNAQAEAAYAAWLASRSPSMPYISYPEWLSWLLSKTSHEGGNGNTYSFVPIGNILPLVLMAMLYMIILFVKRNKTAQL